MKKHQGVEQGGENGARAVLLADRGARSRELGAVFMALARVRHGAESFALQELGDVEDLLLERDGAGTLILECGRVPAEDIGFVRRFLERQPTWKLLVLGDDPQDARARGLLSLPRTRWLPWPPDLEQLATLLGESAGPASAQAAASAPPPPAAERAAPRAPAPSAAQVVAVDDLLEELLAGLSVGGAGAPRFLYRGDEPLALEGDPDLLQEGLAGLFELARVCAGDGQVVNVSAAGLDELAQIRVDFPLGPLTDADLPGVLQGTFEGAPELMRAVEQARKGASLLQAHGASVDLLAQRPGRLRLEVLVDRAG